MFTQSSYRTLYLLCRPLYFLWHGMKVTQRFPLVRHAISQFSRVFVHVYTIKTIPVTRVEYYMVYYSKALHNRHLFYAIENSANQNTWKPFYFWRSGLPVMRCTYVALIVLARVFLWHCNKYLIWLYQLSWKCKLATVYPPRVMV